MKSSAEILEVEPIIELLAQVRTRNSFKCMYDKIINHEVTIIQRENSKRSPNDEVFPVVIFVYLAHQNSRYQKSRKNKEKRNTSLTKKSNFLYYFTNAWGKYSVLTEMKEDDEKRSDGSNAV